MTEPPPSPTPAPPAPTAHLHPRIVPWRHAFAWYEDAMRLFKRAPAAWMGLAVVTLLTELAFQAVPGGFALLREVVTPLVACGLVYAAAAADRGAAVSLMYAIAAFRAPVGAIGAVVGSALLLFGAEAFAGWWIAGINLFDPGRSTTDLSPAAVVGIYAFGILASLPLTFVPFHALLERVRPGAAFAASWNAFALNTVTLLVYGALSFVLLGLSLVTMGIGLVLALPLWAASSFAAWKDIFGVRDAPEPLPPS
jgi:uncharacterized membrane protein